MGARSKVSVAAAVGAAAAAAALGHVMGNGPPAGASAPAPALAAVDAALAVVHAPAALDSRAAAALTTTTARLWRDHVNAGFLAYRKSCGGDGGPHVDWTDAGGAWVADAAGTRYLDCLSSFGVHNLGHGHPVVVQAVAAQLAKQPLHSQEFLDAPRAFLAAALAAASPCPASMTHTWLANSGTEAVEVALKLAMLTTGRVRVLAATGGFHGKTLGALAATSKAQFRAPFAGALMDVVHVAFNDVGALRAAFATAAFTGTPFAACLLEVVQGEGGVHVATPEFLGAAREACTAAGTALILDEIQSGMGRTGKLWACQHYPGIVPDLMCVGKALSGGVVPVAAVVGAGRYWAEFERNPHLASTTFGGNPLACAAAIAALHVTLHEDLPGAAAARGAQLLEGLRALVGRHPKLLVAARGLGLMTALEFTTNAGGVAWGCALLRRRVIVSGTMIAATVVRVCPPLVITPGEVQWALEAMEAAAVEAENVVAGRIPARL
jgi:putrescine aminotransferase